MIGVGKNSEQLSFSSTTVDSIIVEGGDKNQQAEEKPISKNFSTTNIEIGGLFLTRPKRKHD